MLRKCLGIVYLGIAKSSNVFSITVILNTFELLAIWDRFSYRAIFDRF